VQRPAFHPDKLNTADEKTSLSMPNNHEKQPFRRSAVIIALTLLFVVLGCGQVVRAGQHHRASRSTTSEWQPGATPFQKSLHDSFSDLYDLEKVRQWVMYVLLGEFAKRDGPSSMNQLRLRELDTLHIVSSAGRVAELFREGLAELDRLPDSLGRSAFIDRDVTERARQILTLHCFKPESAFALDALGRLIALHGVCELDTWTETTIIVTFRNRWMYWIGESDTYEHTILRVGRDRSELTRLSDKAVEKAGGMPDDELAYDEDLYSYTDVGMLAESKIPEMQQQSEVSVYVNYDALNLATVNVHPLPTCYGDGRWNGKPAETESGAWNWTRLFVDIFVNRDQFTLTGGRRQSYVDLVIAYDIYRLRDSSAVRVLGETLPHRQSLIGVGENDGVVISAITAPFFTGADSCQGLYQLSFSISDGTRTAVQKLPFRIEDGHYELLMVHDTGSLSTGIPPFPRIPTSKIPDSLHLLVTVKGLPYSAADQACVGKLKVYLIDNKERSEGTVQLGDIYTSEFGDSTGATLPVPAPSDSRMPAPALIASFDLSEPRPDFYLIRRIDIPKQLANGTIVTRGTYTLWAVVTAGGETISETTMTNLRIE
jgi:hypothetical protein